VRLPHAEELAAAAGRSKVVGQLRAFAQWLGPKGRGLTPSGNIRPADARELITLLGTSDEGLGFRSAAELPGLDLIANWAKKARLVRRQGTRLVPVAKARTVVADTSTLLVVEDDQELADEITARLRALRASGPVSVDTGRGRVLDVLQPYIDDLTRRNERGARRAAADTAIAVLFGLYECREDTDEDLLLVRMGLPGAADDLARIVYVKVKPLHLSLPSLADECPEWEWYEES
jgi:hypothetical protein